MEPYCIYDGDPSDLTHWLEEQGVKIIYHRSSFSEDIAKIFGEDLPARGGRGAMLRVDIPKILSDMRIDDPYLLYTDCDVMFIKDVGELLHIRPKYFACAPEFDPDNWDNINTGVMLMNVKNLYKTYEELASFIRKNMKKEWVWDQTAYNLFYKGKITKLPLEYNWKPYWGDSPNKRIVHFHGPKPTQREFLDNWKDTERQILFELYNRDRETYHKLFHEWDNFLSQA